MNKKKKVLTHPAGIALGAMVSCALWGGAFPAIKIGYELYRIASDDIGGQIVFAGIRFVLAGILAWIIGSILHRRPLWPKKSSWGRIVLLGLLQTFGQYFFFYIGLAHTTGVKAAIIEALNVFVAILVAALIFREEKLSGKKILGCAIGFLGVVLLEVGSGIGNLSFSIAGEGCIFFSTVAYAFSSVLIRRFSQNERPFTLSAFQFIFGGLELAAVGARIRARQQVYRGNIDSIGGTAGRQSILSTALSDPKALWILLLLAAISGVAYSLWGELLKYNEVSKVTVYGFMTPVFGVLFSALFLREAQGAGPAVIIVSLALVSFGTWMVQRNAKPGPGKKKERIKSS